MTDKEIRIRQRLAARAMLAALERMDTVLAGIGWIRREGDAIEEMQAAIAQAKAAGLSGGPTGKMVGYQVQKGQDA